MPTFFSIVIPTYNLGHLIGRAIGSVLKQPLGDFELIVVDDGSKDNTRLEVEKFQDSRIRYVFQENKGVCGARNHGARLASGKFLVFLDADDWLKEDTLNVFFSGIRPDTNIVLGSIYWFNATGILKRLISPNIKEGKFNQGLPGSFAIDSALFSKMGGYDENLFYSENSDLFLRLRLANKMLPERVVLKPEGGVCKPLENSRDRRKRYSEKKYRSVKYFLEKHETFFKSSTRDFVNFKRMHAMSALQNNNYPDAIARLREIAHRMPYSMKARLHYYFVLVFPRLARLYYGR
jgi:glycosyltransferase involved in cell wall biosynthesis